MPPEYEIVVGLEVHAQLLTQTKLFCGDTTIFGKEPNTQVSAISLGHPGTLPRLNKEAIHLAVKLGLACRCEIVQHNYFARKNYFYPDLPKGYQVSQHTTPICRNGIISITTREGEKNIRINRIHIEEDAGKSIHTEPGEFSNIDYNRAGMALLEIVTEPDIRSAEEAFEFVSTLRKMVRHLEVCDGNMEQGSFRCDVNISVRLKGDNNLGTRVEVKNLNSLRFIKKAIEFESARLISLHQKGETILQQTRGFNEDDFTTYAIRTKEDEDDYRYFAEPDLPPFFISDHEIENTRKRMPPSQEDTKKKLVENFDLGLYDADQISSDPDLTSFYLELAKNTKNYKAAANWVIGPIKNWMAGEDLNLETIGLKPGPIAEIIQLVEEGKINHGIAVQKIFPALIKDPLLDIKGFIKSNHLSMSTSNSEMDEWIELSLNKYSQKITEYKKGKKGLISLFVGEVMKLSNGKADAKLVTDKIIEKLKNS